MEPKTELKRLRKIKNSSQNNFSLGNISLYRVRTTKCNFQGARCISLKSQKRAEKSERSRQGPMVPIETLPLEIPIMYSTTVGPGDYFFSKTKLPSIQVAVRMRISK